MSNCVQYSMSADKDDQGKSLVDLTVAIVALYTPVSEILAYVEYLPAVIRHQLFRELPKFRLREMELEWEAAAAKVEAQEPRDGFDPLAGDRFLFDLETQREWEARMASPRWVYIPNLFKNKGAAHERKRNYRHVFWEHEFRSMLKLRKPANPGYVDDLKENLKFFVDVVEILKLRGREVCKDNMEIILALRDLRRLEVHHPEQQHTCWDTLKRLVQENCHLTELGFFHGRLSDSEIAQIRAALIKPTQETVEVRQSTCRITTLELVSVKMRSEGYRQLVALVDKMPQLLQLRISSCITNFDTKLLVDAALRVPALQRLFLEHNDLEDDAFVGLAKIRKPLALRHIRLNDNDISFTTIGAICSASMDGVLNLERLELTTNAEIGDPGIHALTPMLASPATVLTHLDVCSCNFGLEGVTSLLLALGHNKTVKYLNIAHNFLDVGFGDVLADFLVTNSSITHLQANGVGIGLAGVSARLLMALEGNLTLTSLSLGANRLQNDGATAILGALVKRAQLKPFSLVDLSGNLITLSGLATIADIFDNFTNADVPHADSILADRTKGHDGDDLVCSKRRRIDNFDNDSKKLSVPHNTKIVPTIEELCLLNNHFNRIGADGGDSTTLIETIRRRVGHLKSNEWVTQHQVYDDEV